MLLSAGEGCSNCQSRGEKCDETRPSCNRCTRAGIQCTRYPTRGSLVHGVSESRPKQTQNLTRAAPTSVASLSDRGNDSASSTTGASVPDPSVAIDKTAPSVPPEARNPSLITQRVGSDNVGATITSEDIPSTSIPDPWSRNSFLGNSTARIEELNPVSAATTRTSYVQPIVRRTFTPPYGPYDHPRPSVVSTSTLAALQNTGLKRMTSGQASLFDALFSLARPGEEYHEPSALKAEPSCASDQAVRAPSPGRGGRRRSLMHENGSIRDTEGIHHIMTKTLKLDRNVESNSMPWILESYASWIVRMLFQPLQVAAAAREYVFRKHARSDVSRRNLMLISIVARTVALNSACEVDDLPALAHLRYQVSQGYMIAAAGSASNSSQSVVPFSASDAIDSTYELISISCKLFSISAILSIMQTAAPVFRRACPDPPEDFVHLPGLLLHIDYHLRYFASMDILLSILTDRPMFFRYNVDFTAKVTESMLQIENHLGMLWLYGVPDRLVVTLARINALREDFGICTDEKVVRVLEIEIGSFQPVVATSLPSDPVLTVARLVVQECWRQAAYIYLYMGLCGANAQDARVRSAHNKFMGLFKGARPAQHPDEFLVFPILILGLPTQNQQDRDMIKQRMLRIPDCARPGILGNQLVHMLDDIWTQAFLSGRPATWSDLRLACLRVTGI